MFQCIYNLIKTKKEKNNNNILQHQSIRMREKVQETQTTHIHSAPRVWCFQVRFTNCTIRFLVHCPILKKVTENALLFLLKNLMCSTLPLRPQGVLTFHFFFVPCQLFIHFLFTIQIPKNGRFSLPFTFIFLQ